MLGYIIAAWRDWGTHQHPPEGLGEASGAIGTSRDECSRSVLEALGSPQAQGALGTGRAVPVGVGVLGQLREARCGGAAEPSCEAGCLTGAGSWPKDKESKVGPLGPGLETSFLQREGGMRLLGSASSWLDTGEGLEHLLYGESWGCSAWRGAWGQGGSSARQMDM